jgi:hypothetical protein
MKSVKILNSIKNYTLQIALGTLATIAVSCSKSPESKNVNNNNYIVREISIADVDSFNIKQKNRLNEEITKISGYVKGVNNSGSAGGLNFLLEDDSGFGKFCQFYGSSDISALLESVMDMRKVSVNSEIINVYATINDDAKLLMVKKVEYANRTFDWSDNIDTKKLFENVNYNPITKEISLDSLINTNIIKNMTHIKTKGYIMGKSSSNELAFVLSDEKGNSILCYADKSNSTNSFNNTKSSQLRTLVDALNQVPTKVEVDGHFTKSYGNLLILESMTTPTSVGYESNTIALESNAPKDASDYMYVSAKDAKKMQDY